MLNIFGNIGELFNDSVSKIIIKQMNQQLQSDTKREPRPTVASVTEEMILKLMKLD